MNERRKQKQIKGFRRFNNIKKTEFSESIIT